MFKKLPIKILSAILIISTLCAVFAGCVKEDGDTAESSNVSGSTAAITEPPTTEPPEEEYVEGGIDLSEYCIVRAKDASSETRNAIMIFKNFLSVYCGVEVSVKTDDKAETSKEILFGLTNRSESETVYTDLDANDWSISLDGEKIVLAAGSKRDIVNTTNYLVENCLRKNSRYVVLGDTPILSDTLPSTSSVALTLDGNKLNYLRVALLYKNGAYTDNVGFTEAALLLADNVRMECEITTEVTAYAENSTFTQILIASAENGSDHLPSGISVGSMQYALCRKGNNIIIVANDAMGAEMGAQEVIRAIRGASDTLELNTLCKNSAVTYTYGQNLDLESEGEYRIMTYNIERVELNKAERSDLLLNNIQFYNPDVVGFQEFCTDLKQTFGLKLKNSGYTMVEPVPELYDSSDTSCASRYSLYNNYTPIAYKTAKFELLESGAKRIIPARTSGNSIQGSYGWPGYTCTWAVLKDRTTGEVFAVTSLHNKTGGGTTDQEKKVVSLGIVKGIIDKIVKNHSCPVFMVGDYNSRETYTDYKSFVKTSNNIFDSRYVAERGYSVGGSHDSSGNVVCSGTTANAIDHILVTGNARVLRHRYGHSINVAKASDHKPVFIDVIVGSAPIDTDTTAMFSGFGSMKINKGIAAPVEKVENLALKKVSE